MLKIILVPLSLISAIFITNQSNAMDINDPRSQKTPQAPSFGQQIIDIPITIPITKQELMNNGFNESPKIEQLAQIVCRMAAEKVGINPDCTKNPIQGWNGIAFYNKNQEYLIKFARGADETKDFKRIIQILDNRGSSYELGVSIPTPKDIFKIQLGGDLLKEGDNEITVQIIPFFKNEASFGILIARTLQGEWWFDANGHGDWQQKPFNKEADLRLMRFLGKSVSKFQRGGKTLDEAPALKRTLIHGDLYMDHVLIDNYSLNNEKVDTAKIDPRFALIDVVTLQQVDDTDETKLLVDPLYLSSAILTDYDVKKRKNLAGGMLNLFNNFYMGYVDALSRKTLDKLASHYKSQESALAALEKVVEYENSIGKIFKTREKGEIDGIPVNTDQRKLFEKELVNLHRLTFLNAYYEKINKDPDAKRKIVEEQKNWKISLFQK